MVLFSVLLLQAQIFQFNLNNANFGTFNYPPIFLPAIKFFKVNERKKCN